MNAVTVIEKQRSQIGREFQHNRNEAHAPQKLPPLNYFQQEKGSMKHYVLWRKDEEKQLLGG